MCTNDFPNCVYESFISHISAIVAGISKSSARAFVFRGFTFKFLAGFINSGILLMGFSKPVSYTHLQIKQSFFLVTLSIMTKRTIDSPHLHHNILNHQMFAF